MRILQHLSVLPDAKIAAADVALRAERCATVAEERNVAEVRLGATGKQDREKRGSEDQRTANHEDDDPLKLERVQGSLEGMPEPAGVFGDGEPSSKG